MENMGIQKLAKELKMLNPNTYVKFKTDIYPTLLIVRCSDCTKLTLPKGYYLNDKNGLTNKHNTASGMYESFEIMTEYEYLRELC